MLSPSANHGNPLTTRCMRQCRNGRVRYRICFTHGDITPHNILVNENLRPCALVDWSVLGGCPSTGSTHGHCTYVSDTLDGRRFLRIFFLTMRQSSRSRGLSGPTIHPDMNSIAISQLSSFSLTTPYILIWDLFSTTTAIDA